MQGSSGHFEALGKWTVMFVARSFAKEPQHLPQICGATSTCPVVSAFVRRCAALSPVKPTYGRGIRVLAQVRPSTGTWEPGNLDIGEVRYLSRVPSFRLNRPIGNISLVLSTLPTSHLLTKVVSLWISIRPSITT